MTAPAAAPAAAALTAHLNGFWVVVDGVPLPSFSECQGLGAECAVEPWTEGGQNGFVHQLPGRITYSPITLTRCVDRASSGLAAWFSSVTDPSTPYRTARISALDPTGRALASWDLKDVFPSRYTGPSFTTMATTPATESLELVHHGFAFTYAGG